MSNRRWNDLDENKALKYVSLHTKTIHMPEWAFDQLVANQVPQVDFSTWFYRNCKRRRKDEAKICQVCPFRIHIEQQEAIRNG